MFEFHKIAQSFKNRPIKIYGRQPLTIFTWSILEYIDPNNKGYTAQIKEAFFQI